MSTSSPSPRADHPTLVLEVGRLARAVRRLLLGSSPRAGDDEDAPVLRRPNLSLVRAEGELEGDILRGELDRLLSLPEMIANQNAGGPPRLYVFIIADVTEPGVAEAWIGRGSPPAQGATTAVRFPESRLWNIQPVVPSASRTLRQLSYSWMISSGRPRFT